MAAVTLTRRRHGDHCHWVPPGTVQLSCAARYFASLPTHQLVQHAPVRELPPANAEDGLLAPGLMLRLQPKSCAG